MAKLFVCAVRDRAVDAFGQPFFVRHKNEAIRSFKEEINRDGSVFKNHPDDYDLYHLGAFDDGSGRLDPAEPELIAIGKSLVNNTKE